MLVVFYSIFNGKIRLQLFVKANAKQNRLQIFNDSVQLWIKQAPVKGKANKEIVKYLASILEIHKNTIAITQGVHSTTKIVELAIDESDFLSKIKHYIVNEQ